MAAVDNYWLSRYDAAQAMYACPNCDRHLKEKLSQSEKNPGAKFVSCSADYGGCGFFGFLREAPNPKFLKGGKKPAAKKAKTAGESGNVVVGPIAAIPSVVEQRLAELATAIDALTSQQREIMDYIKQVTEN